MALKLLPTQTIALLNAIRNDATDNYKERVPVATQENIREYGASLQNDKRLYNEFVDCLIGRIGLTIIGAQEYRNPLKRFKKGQLRTGDTIQDIFVDIATAEGVFDPTGSNPLGRRKEDVVCYFHKIDRKDEYAKSISKPQLLSAFTSVEKIGDFISKQMEALYSGAEWDEYLATVELLGQFTPFVEEYEVPDFTTSANITTSNLQKFVKTCKKAYSDLKFMSRKHNYAGVARKSDIADMTLFIRKDLNDEIDVEVLASAFNMNKTDFIGKVIEVENFGQNDNIATDGAYAMLSTAPVMAMLVDDELIQIYDQLVEMATIYNPQGLFENYFYHIWQVLSARKFANAVLFTAKPNVVVNVLSGSTSKVGYALYQYVWTDKDGVSHTQNVRFDATKDGSGVTIKLANVFHANNGVSLYTKDGVLLSSATIASAVNPAGTSVTDNIGLSSGVIAVKSGHTFDAVPSYVNVTLN